MSTAALAEPATLPPAARALQQLRSHPRLPLMVAASLAIAALAAFLLWSRAPDFRVLYGQLSDRDGGAIITALQQANVPYRFAEGGTALLVPADKVAELRLKLAAQGLPKGGTVGFELMDNQKFGTSQFAEQVNYQRALEGELARSINAISAVESARVHLAMPKPSLFVRDQKKPSASVVLTLHRGRSIDESQVQAVVHLVSSSVPDLAPRQISVVDQHGNLLSSPAMARGLDGSQLKYTQELEQAYVRRIEAILHPILGTGNVHAQVAADVDFSVVEATDEKYQPNQEPGRAAVRSQQSSDSAQSGGQSPAGTPGALANQPPPNAVAPITQPPGTPPATAAADAGAARGNSRRDATVNYEVDRSIRHVQQSAGALRRVSVAVVVNHREVVDAQGQRSVQPLSAAELESVRNLVREAMGFSAQRGDSLNVVNSAFSQVPAGPELPWWQQPQALELARQGGLYLLAGLVVLYLWFAVARPLLRRHLVPELPPQVPLPAPATVAVPPAVAQEATQLLQDDQQRTADRHAENLQYARELAEKEPLMVAMLIKNWMAPNGQ